MKRLLLLLLLVVPQLLVAAPPNPNPEPVHLQIARKYVGVTEATGRNDGKEVEMFLRYTGLGRGNPYCAAFVSFCIGRANVAEPLIVSAAARRFVTEKSVRSSDVLGKNLKIPPGTIVVWQRGTGWQGHVGFVTRQTGTSTFRTIEANTSPGTRGSQYDGGGVYERTRQIVLTNHFRIIAFTFVKYAPQQTFSHATHRPLHRQFVHLRPPLPCPRRRGDRGGAVAEGGRQQPGGHPAHRNHTRRVGQPAAGEAQLCAGQGRHGAGQGGRLRGETGRRQDSLLFGVAARAA